MQASHRNRLVRLLLLLFRLPGLGMGASSAWTAGDLPPLKADRPPLFTADVLIGLDPDGRPSQSVSVSVPYTEFQWIKVDRGFAGGGEFTVIFEPRGGGRQFGDVWERKLVIPGFKTTTSPVTALLEKREFHVPAGQYEIRVEVRDLNSGGFSTARSPLRIPDYSRVPVGFSDLELGTADSAAFSPVPTRRFGLNVVRLAARVSLFDRRPGPWPRLYPFRFRIMDELGSEVAAGKRAVTVERSALPVIIRPDSSSLFLGAYVFEVELADGRSHWRVDRSFEVEDSGPPRGAEFERMLEPLSFIAESQEVEHLRSLPPERQSQGWEEFWRRRDPTPDTPRNEAMLEFFRRVRYAQQHFQSFGPGWRSDMGRIYIKFGAPDQTESRPPTSQTLQLEIWYYNRPYRRFVFADRDGFGRYELVSPSSE